MDFVLETLESHDTIKETKAHSVHYYYLKHIILLLMTTNVNIQGIVFIS